VEARSDVAKDDYARLGRQAADVLRSTIGVTIGVDVQAPATLPRYELKAKRFFDHRPAEHRWQLQGRTS
jgi:phenylacetate-CoA ligase